MQPQLAGPRKAAVLMVLMGEEVAAKLMRHLQEDEIAAITREVASLEVIPPEVAQQVLEAYFLDAVRPPEDRGGPEVAERILAKLALPEALRRRWLRGDTGELVEALGPLLESPPRALAKALEEEHPQTRALVVLHLPPRRGAAVLRALPEAARAETVLRMSALRRVREEVLGEVAASLRERLGGAEAPGAEEEASGQSTERTVEILRRMPRAEVRDLLAALESVDPERAEALRRKLFTFESLVQADDRGIQELLRKVETKTLAVALQGAGETLTGKFLKNLSERAAGMLREEMEYSAKARPADIESTRQAILKQALELEQEDKLRFEEEAEDGAGS